MGAKQHGVIPSRTRRCIVPNVGWSIFDISVAELCEYFGLARRERETASFITCTGRSKRAQILLQQLRFKHFRSDRTSVLDVKQHFDGVLGTQNIGTHGYRKMTVLQNIAICALLVEML